MLSLDLYRVFQVVYFLKGMTNIFPPAYLHTYLPTSLREHLYGTILRCMIWSVRLSENSKMAFFALSLLISSVKYKSTRTCQTRSGAWLRKELLRELINTFTLIWPQVFFIWIMF